MHTHTCTHTHTHKYIHTHIHTHTHTHKHTHAHTHTYTHNHKTQTQTHKHKTHTHKQDIHFSFQGCEGSAVGSTSDVLTRKIFERRAERVLCGDTSTHLFLPTIAVPLKGQPLRTLPSPQPCLLEPLPWCMHSSLRVGRSVRGKAGRRGESVKGTA